MLPNEELVQLLSHAYKPCLNFEHCNCKQAEWKPSEGHIPRGYLGATGRLDEVKVIMVFAQPSRPHDDEKYSIKKPREMLADTIEHVYGCYKNRTDLFHRNVRWFMDELYPNKSFDEQLKHIWLTESRLCSFYNKANGGGNRICAKEYLIKQINLLPSATVVVFGRKAESCLLSLGVDFTYAWSLGPPGADKPPARPSWLDAIEEIKEKINAK